MKISKSTVHVNMTRPIIIPQIPAAIGIAKSAGKKNSIHLESLFLIAPINGITN